GSALDQTRGSFLVRRSGALLLEDRAGERHAFGNRQLRGVANEQPGVLRARNRALDEQEAAIGVGAHDLEVLLRALTVAHVARHLLVLKDAARILAITRRTVRTVAERNAVRRAQTAEAPALHRAGKPRALRVAGDVDLLPGDEVLGTDRRADRHQAFLVLNAELGDLHLQRHFRLRESFALRLVHVLLLGLARTDLKRE